MNDDKLLSYTASGDDNLKQKHYSKAASEYRKALALNPSDAKLHFKLGNSYYLQGIKEENETLLKYAVVSFKKSIELDPLYEEAHSHLMEIYYKMSNLNELAVEYNGKIKLGVNTEFYKKLLNQVSIISAIQINKPPEERKRMSLFIRIFFDYVLLSFSILTLCISFSDEKAASLMPLGLIMLGFYIAYKLFTFYLLGIKPPKLKER